MKRPFGLYMIGPVLVVLSCYAAFLLSYWPATAIPLAIIAGSATGILQGKGRARVGAAAGLLGISGTCIYAMYRFWPLAQELNLTGSKQFRTYLPWVMAALVSIAAIVYLYTGRASRHFQSVPHLTVAKPITAAMAISSSAVLAVSVFFFAGYPRLMGWPVDVQEAARVVATRMSKENLVTLAETPRDGLAGYHLGLGMAIRNDFGLWGVNSRLLRSACGGEWCHPDIASSVIIDRLWQNQQDGRKE